MARDAIRLFSDSGLYQRMVEACLSRARNAFCNNRITADYEDIYYRVLGRAAPERKSGGGTKSKLSCLG
ncbi:hypothetical protein D3C75_1181660 [compost metagenome]